jgi:hypothetical protein
VRRIDLPGVITLIWMCRSFDYIDPDKQGEVYSLARQLTADFAWGGGDASDCVV